MKKSMWIVGLLWIAGIAVAEVAQPGGVMTGEKSSTLWELIKVGGWTMVPLGLCSVFSMYLLICNIVTLRAKNLLRMDLKPEIEALLARRDVQGAREVCQTNRCLMTAVLDAGLGRISENDFDPEHVMEAIEAAGNVQMVTFMKPINYLSMIGAAAPMMGLLGTVSGIIKAFATISAGAMGKPELLAANIGEALVATAAGLVIAIPAMMAYSIFKTGFLKNMSTMIQTIEHFMSVYRNSAA